MPPAPDSEKIVRHGCVLAEIHVPVKNQCEVRWDSEAHTLVAETATKCMFIWKRLLCGSLQWVDYFSFGCQTSFAQ